MKINVLAIIGVLAALALFIFAYNAYNKQVQQENKEKVLAFIADHNGMIFNYAALAQELRISEMKVFKCAYELEQEDRIYVENYPSPRKPILINLSDYKHYYYKLYISSKAEKAAEMTDVDAPL